MALIIQVPDYRHELFVNRDRETKEVVKKLQELLAGRPVDKRTIVFSGEYGLGKTWLLKHIYNTILEKIESSKRKSVYRLFIDLNEYREDDPVVATAAILEWASRNLFKESLPGTSLAEVNRAFVDRLRDFLGNERVLLVFVEAVYRASWDLLAALENYFLGPLAIEPRVLILLDSQRRGYPWKTPELRVKAESCSLDLFDKERTKEQVEKIVAQKRRFFWRRPEVDPNRIYELSQGHPLANYLLTTLWAEKKVAPPRALNEVIEQILEKSSVPEGERAEARQYMEALCVLRAFDEERIRAMLSAYAEAMNLENKEEYADWGYARTREVRKKLVQWGLASWNDEQNGFTLNESLRQLAEEYLQQEKPEVWRALHRRACKLYEEWQGRYERTSEKWKEEAEFHRSKLQQEEKETPSLSQS